MDIKWIEDFLSLAHTRSFSRSAEDRHITQPAFSRRIRALEAWVGADLVDRSTYPLTLTAAGKLFNDAARDSVILLDDARALVRGQRSDDHLLQVAAGHTLSLNFFPMWLNGVQSRLGSVPARILATNVHDSVLSLVKGNCDLLLCYHHPELPIELDPNHYDFIGLGREVVIPVSVPNRVGRPSFSLPGRKGKPTATVAYTGASYFGRVVELIHAKVDQESHLHNSYESDMAELLKKMALAGYGLAWLPESSIVSELAEGRLVYAGGSQWSLTLDIRLFRCLGNEKPSLVKLWNGITNKL